MREKIAFVVSDYGPQAKGGTEKHCQMLAERLVDGYDVEVLTTNICDVSFIEKVGLPRAKEWHNRVLVRKFEATPVNADSHDHYLKSFKRVRRLRKHLFQLGILRFWALLNPVWHCGTEKEEQIMKSYSCYSPDMFRYIREHKDEYKVFIAINISFPLAYYVSLYVPERTILIPTMHNESSSFRAIYTHVFTKVSYVAFNSSAEQRLARRIFGKRNMSRHGVIGVGVEQVTPAAWEQIKMKYNLPEEYLLYVGRIEKSKLYNIIRYFTAYKKKYPYSNLKCVLVGDHSGDVAGSSEIVYTGFVDEHEKYAIIRHAKVLVNPSKFESLSLILLEGMQCGKAMLVNGKCEVLKEHCRKSNHAAVYYTGKRSFMSQLHRLDSDPDLRVKMGEKGRKYVEENYNWDLILSRLTEIIESF